MVFRLVQFLDEEENDPISVVPENWLNLKEDGNFSCYWPPYLTDDRVNRAKSKKEVPDVTKWRNCEIKTVYAETAGTYKNLHIKISENRNFTP